MAKAIVSTAAERIFRLVEEQARHHINLVRGAEKEVRGLAVDLENIRNVLDDAEDRRFEDKNIDNWLSRIEQTAYEIEDVLDEWDYALLKLQVEERRSEANDTVVSPSKKKVCSFIPSSSCLGFKKVVRNDIAIKIPNVKAQLDEISIERDRYSFLVSPPTLGSSPKSWRDQSTPLVDVANVHGRDNDRDILVNRLMNDDGSQEEFGIQIVSIVGIGGLGKTTLAQLVYNHSRVKEYFELRIWICVSDPFDLVAISKGIVESINNNSIDTHDLDVLLRMVQASIYGRRFLLVLDDVWTEDYGKWEPLEATLICGGAGSRVLMTTRNERVARMMGSRESLIYHPGLLSDEDCWLLVCRVAHSVRNEVGFEEIDKKIAKQCNGLPLAAMILGRFLLSKSSFEEWEIKEALSDIFPHLLLSYKYLSPTLKLCFTHCAVFPKDCMMDVQILIENWMALGYLGSNDDAMELRGRECFNVLAMHSLFQDFEKNDFGEIISCKMHDIVHDFSQFVRKRNRDQVGAMGMKKRNICRACDPSQVSSVNEFRCLYCDEETPPNICDCLTRLKVLSLKCSGLRSVPQGMETLIHLRWLNMTSTTKLFSDDLKIIFKLYFLQTLTISDCGLEEIPREIGNLIELRRLELKYNETLKELPQEIGNLIWLRHLDLSGNDLKELPLEIGNLIQLRHLDLSGNDLKELPLEIGNLIQLIHLNLNENKSLGKLPESMHRLKIMQTLNNLGCKGDCRLPVRVTQLTGPRAMNEFRGGNGWCKLRLLKNLNHLEGVLWFRIRVDDECYLMEVVGDAREAELKSKSHVEGIRIFFEEASSAEDVMDALQAHPNLRELAIWNYEGTKLPMWMVNPLNQLTNLSLHFCNHLTSLPPFGKLPCLEEIYIDLMESLETVGREFLGLTTGEGGAEDVVVFPKLKTLKLQDCGKWTVWEDITTEEEESAAFSVMPCLTKLTITGCNGLTMLPHCLLRKASSLETLRISGSIQLVERYEKMDGSDWKSISKENSEDKRSKEKNLRCSPAIAAAHCRHRRSPATGRCSLHPRALHRCTTQGASHRSPKRHLCPPPSQPAAGTIGGYSQADVDRLLELERERTATESAVREQRFREEMAEKERKMKEDMEESENRLRTEICDLEYL